MNQVSGFFHTSDSLIDDTAFYSHFLHAFPLPQQGAWCMVYSHPQLISNIFEMLNGKELALQQWIMVNRRDTGMSGHTSKNSQTEASISAHHHSMTNLIWEGNYSRCHMVQLQAVETALQYVAQKFVLDGYVNPCCTANQDELDLTS